MSDIGSVLGRTIKVFLVDGTPTGMITAEIMNWTGKVLVAPGGSLAKLANREEVASTGVYLLLGDNPDDPLKPRLYIGETDDVRKRLAQHVTKGEFDIARACVIVSADANLTKDHVRWLESRLIKAAKAAKRTVVVNVTDPGFEKLPEPDRADMAVFFAHVALVLPVVGLDVLKPLPLMPQPTVNGIAAPASESTTRFEFAVGDAPARAFAEAAEIDGKLVVLKGSTARRHGVSSWTSYRGLRQELEGDGRLASHPSNDALLVFTEDVPFNTPSAASVCVAARNENGALAWKVKGTGQTYREWQEAQIATADTNSVT